MRTASGAAAPLSKLHEMLAKIERSFDGHEINRIANHPAIWPFVRGYDTGRLDFSASAANPANVLLVGEHGCIMFHQQENGSFEAHTMALPEGRGRWTIDFVNAALHWMFCHTGAFEIFTRVPKGNKAALGLVRAIHGRYEFERRDGWVMDMDPVSCGIYSRSIVDWIRDAPGLCERGAWYYRRLKQEYEKIGSAKQLRDDTVCNRYVGAAIEMFLSGQPDKGALLYNRWALMAGDQPVQIVAREPLTLRLRDALIIVRDGDFWVPTLCQ